MRLVWTLALVIFAMSSGSNGCTHVHTTNRQEGDDLVTRCDACGQETARTKDYYKD